MTKEEIRRAMRQAREDLGIAGAKGSGMIFKKGEIIKKCKEEELLPELLRELDELI